ncbi:MAG: hypothetical protein ACOX0M_05550 [Salinivirgaceae bacterium]|jgi:hypothetical protein|nr:hypothetical protein [Bacteroidales bacterium]
MKKTIYFLIALFTMAFIVSCNTKSNETMDKKDFIQASTVERVTQTLLKSHGDACKFRVEKGISQVADLWIESDGSEADFEEFCRTYFVADPAELDKLYNRLERNFEIISGKLHQVDVLLKEPVQMTGIESSPVDVLFAGYDISAHVSEDFYNNKIALITALNFPFYSLEEKTTLGENWTRKQWAFARMGDQYISRIPASIIQEASQTLSDADNYISAYNIFMGNLLNEEGKMLFPADMKLITHWGLRDELKSNYADAENGLEKQEMIYTVMKRIIDQSIPSQVINSGEFMWNPISNKIYQNGEEVQATPEADVRYETLLKNFKVTKAYDTYSSHYPNAISRNFDRTTEIPVDDVKKLFTTLLSSPQVKEVATIIKSRLGRDLRPYDIWYNGFKARGTMSEEELNKITSKKYPTPMALEKDLPNILVKLGWKPEKAKEIANLVQVDPSVGAGHAWGAVMRGDKARLRTRIGENGMDYKGYNIAVHEFGHNVEQTITLYDVDYWMLNGVPNTAFTEAVAFVFQKRDMELLGFEDVNSDADAYLALDNFWSCYEIMGVALVDIAAWEWMYANPNVTPAQLKEAVINEAKKVWNEYYAGILGDKDEPILGIYSHMIDYPLYLSNYPIGHLISFQVEQAMKGKNMADEIQRMYTQGRIVPQLWMKNAVGTEISTEPLLKAVDEAIAKLGSSK